MTLLSDIILIVSLLLFQLVLLFDVFVENCSLRSQHNTWRNGCASMRKFRAIFYPIKILRSLFPTRSHVTLLLNISVIKRNAGVNQVEYY